MTKTNAQTKTVSKTAKVTKAPAKPKAATKAPAKKPEPKVDPDTITVSKPHKLDGSMLVKSAGGEELILSHADAVRLLDYIGEGKSFAVAKAQSLVPAKGKAQLARGITAKDAEQSAKAVADQHKGAAKATNKADAATQKPAEAKKAARKAEAAAAKGDRKYKPLVKLSDITLRDGTWTKVMVETAMGHTSTDAANAALAKNREYGSRKIDWKWLADTRHYIKFA